MAAATAVDAAPAARICACKGVNTCFQCENQSSTPYKPFISPAEAPSYVFCPLCHLAWPGWETNSWRCHPHHEGTPIRYPGAHVILDVLTVDEENSLMEKIDAMPWDASQSGRRKQNFGPKTNFKRRKLKVAEFKGFPDWGKLVQERCTSYPVLQGYQTIEQCSLEYRPSEGACILPHIDDCWVWGERVVTLSMLSDSVLTLVKYNGDEDKYNLAFRPAARIDCDDIQRTSKKTDSTNTDGDNRCQTIPNITNGSLEVCLTSETCGDSTTNDNGVAPTPLEWQQLERPPTVRLPMPRRSLLVLEDSARYEWLHGVLREDVSSRRVCIALREFTPAFLPGGEDEEAGKEVLALAQKFWTPPQPACGASDAG